MSCKCHQQDITNPKFERQSRANAITGRLEECTFLIRKFLEERMRDALEKQYVDTPTLRLLLDLSSIVSGLIGANNSFDERALDHEDRLEELEKQIEELKKRLPVGDGK